MADKIKSPCMSNVMFIDDSWKGLNYCFLHGLKNV